MAALIELKSGTGDADIPLLSSVEQLQKVHEEIDAIVAKNKLFALIKTEILVRRSSQRPNYSPGRPENDAATLAFDTQTLLVLKDLDKAFSPQEPTALQELELEQLEKILWSSYKVRELLLSEDWDYSHIESFYRIVQKLMKDGHIEDAWKTGVPFTKEWMCAQEQGREIWVLLKQLTLTVRRLGNSYLEFGSQEYVSCERQIARLVSKLQELGIKPRSGPSGLDSSLTLVPVAADSVNYVRTLGADVLANFPEDYPFEKVGKNLSDKQVGKIPKKNWDRVIYYLGTYYTDFLKMPKE